jgi:hypothetical protein
MSLGVGKNQQTRRVGLLSSAFVGRTVLPGNHETSLMNINLTNRQIYQLAMAVFEENGSCLTTDELDEHIALLLEDVAGFEMASAKTVRRVMTEIRNHYHVTSNEHKDD